MVLSQTDFGVNMRVMRVPKGPTLTFRVDEFSLMRDIASTQKKPHSLGAELNAPPLVVLNCFSQSAIQTALQGNPTAAEAHPTDLDHLKLTATVFQNMFPPIDIERVKLSDCRRLLLLNYNPVNQTIDLRHYVIKAAPTGMRSQLKKLIKIASSSKGLCAVF